MAWRIPWPNTGFAKKPKLFLLQVRIPSFPSKGKQIISRSECAKKTHLEEEGRLRHACNAGAQAPQWDGPNVVSVHQDRAPLYLSQPQPGRHHAALPSPCYTTHLIV